VGADLLGQLDKVIGRVAHGTHDDDNTIPRRLGRNGPRRRPMNARRISDGCTAEFLDYQTHGKGAL
jgi:hypothetical protein